MYVCFMFLFHTNFCILPKKNPCAPKAGLVHHKAYQALCKPCADALCGSLCRSLVRSLVRTCFQDSPFSQQSGSIRCLV